MPCNRGRLAGNTLHQATISQEDVSVVIHDLETLLVIGSGEMGLSDRQADGVRETLTQGTSRDLNSVSMMVFRVTRSFRVNLTKSFQVIQCELVAQKMKYYVLQGATSNRRSR